MTWTLPNPSPIQDRLNSIGDSLREYLEDVEMELLALAWRTAAEMNVVNPAAAEGWSPAQRDIERVLGTQGCKSICFPTVCLAIVKSATRRLDDSCHCATIVSL